MTKITDNSRSSFAKFDSIPMEDVIIRDSFLKSRIEVNRKISIPHQYSECERTGRIDNFRMASGVKDCEHKGYVFNDSDVYKWIEAASYSLLDDPSPEWKNNLDNIISLIRKSQDDDGYLNTAFMGDRKKHRWKDLTNAHELYCGGHLIQAGIAHKRSTGGMEFFDIAVKWADLVCKYFGYNAAPGTPGHQEVEIALVELYRETGDKKYLDQAIYFLEMRGRKPPLLNGSIYQQDHLPIREQIEPSGHAVRQLYQSCGIADVYMENGDATLIEALGKQWDSLVSKKMAITGGCGARYEGEAFGKDYEIPNANGYYETCAQIASFMWNWRMLNITGEARFADIMELTLYNGILSGVSMDGLSYFYTNPLEHDGGNDIGDQHRGSNRRTTHHWDYCACCPPNLARLLASLRGYIYGKNDDSIYVHHYVSNEAHIGLKNSSVKLIQKTDYPWDGNIEIKITPSHQSEFSIYLRIPEWCHESQIEINGKRLTNKSESGTYIEIKRVWSEHDTIIAHFKMEPGRIISHPKVTNNNGCAALKRGPLVYCVEQCDNPNTDIFNILIQKDSLIESEFKRDLLGGTVVLKIDALTMDFIGNLYSRAKDKIVHPEKIKLIMVPYFSWTNREKGAMKVWMPVC